MGQIQNQLNQMLATALGAGIAYQHSPYFKKHRAVQRLSTLENETGAARDYEEGLAAPDIQALYSSNDMAEIEKYLDIENPTDEDFENLVEAMGLDTPYDLDNEDQRAAVEKRMADFEPKKKGAERLHDLYESSYNQLLASASPQELEELISTGKYRGQSLRTPDEVRANYMESVEPMYDINKFVESYLTPEGLKRQVDNYRYSYKAGKAGKEEAKTDEGKPDMLDSWRGFYESLGRAYDGKKTVNDAVQERFSILANPGTAMQGPGANREVFPSRTDESATAIKKTPKVVAKQAGTNYQKPETAVKKPETVVQNPGYKPQKPMETVIKKGQLPTPVPETPDTYEETATAILDKPGSRLYKG